MRMGTIGRAAIAVVGAFIALSASAGEAITGAVRSAVLTQHTAKGQPIPCETQSDGVRVCAGDGKGPDGADLRVKTFDGIPLAVYVTLPPAAASRTDGNYPLVIQSHGWGVPPSGPDDK